MEPEYACAIIEDQRQRLLLQLRPATSTHAPNVLTCFGGRREAPETALQCVQRELHEELCWCPAALMPCGELWKGPRFIARFFRARYDDSPLTTEPGHRAIWVPWSSLDGTPISPWHAQMLQALSHGKDRADLTH